MKQLDRLLFEQGGDCFFCKRPLSKADASVEHLFAQSNGGTSAEENVVACCKAINALLGNKPLKEKFAIVLRQKNGFQCPATSSVVTVPEVPAVKPKAATKQPNVTTTARSTSKSAIGLTQHTPISSVGILALTRPSTPAPKSTSAEKSSIQCPTCRTSVASAVGQIDFVCPKCKGAFRY